MRVTVLTTVSGIVIIIPFLTLILISVRGYFLLVYENQTQNGAYNVVTNLLPLKKIVLIKGCSSTLYLGNVQ